MICSPKTRTENQNTTKFRSHHCSVMVPIPMKHMCQIGSSAQKHKSLTPTLCQTVNWYGLFKFTNTFEAIPAAIQPFCQKTPKNWYLHHLVYVCCSFLSSPQFFPCVLEHPPPAPPGPPRIVAEKVSSRWDSRRPRIWGSPECHKGWSALNCDYDILCGIGKFCLYAIHMLLQPRCCRCVRWQPQWS